MDLDLVELNDWLADFSDSKRSAGDLSTMYALCEYFGHPENACPCFHVAGSKGKGTISASIASILSAAGYKVGIYGSPHVLHFTERVRLADGPFPEKVYQTAEKELKTGIADILNQGIIPKKALTWSRLVNLFAMLCFRAAKVDFAVYEVGVGGRLDSTNVISPICIAMGPIELEHTKFLGDTLTKIATEKAGVFKPNVPVISSPQPKEVKNVFTTAAKANSTTVTYVPQADYQIVDAKIAELAAKIALPTLEEKTIKSGLEQVSLPARYEIIKNLANFPSLPYLLLDGAHTVNSSRAVLGRMQKDGIRGNLLFGCAADKNVKEIAKLILDSGLFNKIYLTKPGDFKKSDLESMKEAFDGKAYFANPDFRKTIQKALADSSTEGLPLITLGSFYLAGEVKKSVQQPSELL